MKAELLYPAQCYLGEGPMWHAERKSCFWVDIEGKKFFEYNFISKAVRVRTLDYCVTLIVQDKNNQLVLGLEGGVGRYDLDAEKFTWLANLEKEKPKHRCNDGKADTKGRLWVGTMHLDFNEGVGSLYCLSENFECKKKLDNLTIANGMAWSPDNKHYYCIDSPTHKVRSFLFDETSGDIQFEKDAVIIPKDMGAPDGMTIDEEGMLWIAQWGGFGVYRWNPVNGKLLEKIKLPVPNVSSCTFAGDNLDHLLITTARQDLSPADLQKYPDSGNVFLKKLSVKGVPSNKLFV
jgi:sugar lactone lactonase YvrE